MKQANPLGVFAVASGKGGVGKTNIAVNLGAALAELGRNVLLLDADLGLANVDVLLGLQPQYNLSHVLNGERSLEEIMVSGPCGLKIVPASSGVQKMSELSVVEQGALIRAFSEINHHVDVMIVDTAAGISSSVTTFVRACQTVIVVVCDEPTSLTDAYAFIKLLNRDYGVHDFQILTNMVQSVQQGQALYSKLCKVTDHYLDVNLGYLGAVPMDEYLRKAVYKQAAVVHSYPHSRSSQVFKSLARKLDDWPATHEARGHLEFFVERMIQCSTV